MINYFKILVKWKQYDKVNGKINLEKPLNVTECDGILVLFS